MASANRTVSGSIMALIVVMTIMVMITMNPSIDIIVGVDARGTLALVGPSCASCNGVYGTKGVAATTNQPGGRYYHMMAATTNRHYIFGGLGRDSNALDDVWAFNIATRQWTWVAGSTLGGAIRTHGTNGVAGATYTPGASNSGAMTTDGTNLWYMGSADDSDLSIWKFTPSTAQWTWYGIVGGAVPVMGTKGISSGGRPGRRYRSGLVYYNSNIYLFGGRVYGATGDRNDLWRNSVNTNTWTWLHGSAQNPLFTGWSGVASTKGVYSAANVPGSTMTPSMAVTSTGMIYMYGGNGCGINAASCPASSVGYLDQMWSYNIATNQWSWLYGSAGAISTGIISRPATSGWSSPTTGYPGARSFLGFAIDSLNRIWLAGGTTSDATTYQNDVWTYNIGTNLWQWMAGCSVLTTYVAGTTLSPNNYFGGRLWPTMAIDGYNNIVLMGGLGTQYWGDTWTIGFCGSGTIKPLDYSTSSCTSCLAGKYSDEGLTACTSCAINTYSASSGASSCTACSPPSYTTGTGSTSCTTAAPVCIAGQYTVGTTCVNCPMGKYSLDGSVTACTTCPIYSYTFHEGSPLCTCVPGSQGNGLSCSLCPLGYHRDVDMFFTPGVTACAACAIGTYSDRVGAEVCTSCPSTNHSSTASTGSISEDQCICDIGYGHETNDTMECTPCPLGSYRDADIVNTGYNQCVACPSNSITLEEGSTSINDCICSVGYETTPACHQCQPGFYRDYDMVYAGVSSCAACTLGKYQSSAGALWCSTCPQATYASQQGASSCTSCPAGSTTNGDGATSIDDCISVGCGDGEEPIINANNETSCVPCIVGWYKSSNMTQCEACAIGEYQSATGQSSCVACPSSSTTSSTGSTSISSCKCGGGYSGVTSSCSQCSIGRYRDGSAASTSCVTCSRGRYSASTGMSACTLCSVGTFANVSAATVCTACSIGTWRITEGGSFCADCSLGRYTAVTGTSTCSLCSIGFYQNTPGQSSCVACAVGKWRITEGSSFCADCGTGRYAGSIATSQCSVCSPGKYNARAGASICIDCAAGTYMASTGATACKACTGVYSSNAGATSCSTCPVHSIEVNGLCKCDIGYEGIPATGCTPCGMGTYRAKFMVDNGITSCSACSIGTWSSVSGASSCHACPPHSSTLSSGSTSEALCVCNVGHQFDNLTSSCIECSAGTYRGQSMVDNGISECSPCSVGQYQSHLGASSCIPCPSSHYSSVTGAISCQACPDNTFTSCDIEVGATTVDECICIAGYGMSANESTCVPCVEGFYRNQTMAENGVHECVACANGYYSSAGAIECNPCDAGSWCSSGIMSVCPANFYCPLKSSSPIACLSGTSSPIGSVDPSACA